MPNYSVLQNSYSISYNLHIQCNCLYVAIYILHKTWKRTRKQQHKRGVCKQKLQSKKLVYGISDTQITRRWKCGNKHSVLRVNWSSVCLLSAAEDVCLSSYSLQRIPTTADSFIWPIFLLHNWRPLFCAFIFFLWLCFSGKHKSHIYLPCHVNGTFWKCFASGVNKDP